MVPLKYLSNFWRKLEMLLINCEVNFILTWSENCVIVFTNFAKQNGTFTITDTKLYVPKLIQQLKSGFKRVINWNKYLSKPELPLPLIKTNLGLNFKFHSNLDISVKKLKKFPTYYKIILQNSCLHLTSFCVVPSAIALQALWYNKNIKIDIKSIHLS